MDCACCSFRIDWSFSVEEQQYHSTGAASFVCNQAGKALKPNVTSAGPAVVTLFTTKPRDADIKQFINEQKTIASIDTQIAEFMVEQKKIDPAPVPVIVHHPIDETVQTGDSKLLGGAMSIQSHWKK